MLRAKKTPSSPAIAGQVDPVKAKSQDTEECRAVRLSRFACEVALRHQPDRFSLPCRFAWRSPTPKIQSPAGIETMPITISGQMSPQTAPTP